MIKKLIETHQGSYAWRVLVPLLFIMASISACSTRITPTTQPIAQTETNIPLSPAPIQTKLIPTHAPVEAISVAKVTDTSTPSSAPSDQELISSSMSTSPAEVKYELSFFPGAGGLDCPEDVLLNPETIYPAISAFHPSLMVASYDSIVICLYDFPVDESISIELSGLDGTLLVSGSFIIRVEEVYGMPRLQAYRLDSPLGDDLVGDGFPNEAYPDVVGIDIAWSRSLPNRGLIRVYSEDFHLEDEFYNPFGEFTPWLSISPPDPPKQWVPFVQRGCLVYSTGEKVEFTGGGFSANSKVSVGVYHDLIQQGEMGKLSASGVITTDPDGYLNGTVQVEPTDPVGIYFVIAVLNPEGTHADWDQVGPVTCYQIR